MAIDEKAKAALNNGGFYMPGVPLNFASEEEIARGIALEAESGAADKFYESSKTEKPGKSEKGSDEVRAKMAKVRAAKKAKASDDTEDTGPTGILAAERPELAKTRRRGK